MDAWAHNPWMEAKWFHNLCSLGVITLWRNQGGHTIPAILGPYVGGGGSKWPQSSNLPGVPTWRRNQGGYITPSISRALEKESNQSTYMRCAFQASWQRAKSKTANDALSYRDPRIGKKKVIGLRLLGATTTGRNQVGYINRALVKFVEKSKWLNNSFLISVHISESKQRGYVIHAMSSSQLGTGKVTTSPMPMGPHIRKRCRYSTCAFYSS